MSDDVEAVPASVRMKYEAARELAELYGRMLRELEDAVAAESGGKKARTPRAEKPAALPKKKRPRAKPVKAEVSASDAVLRLLAGCKLGLPVAEIVQYVSATYGHQKNSIRTTLYNLKKKGEIVRGEDGIYSWAEAK